MTPAKGGAGGAGGAGPHVVSILLSGGLPGAQLALSLAPSPLPPLHDAAARGDVPALLVAAKEASVNARDAAGRTALHFAAGAGQLEACAALLDRRCEVDAVDDAGRTALHAAAAGGHVSVLEALLARGAAVDARGKDGRTPLHVAAQHGKAAACACLLARGAAASARIDGEIGVLHLAAASGDVATCEALRAAGADVSAKDRAGTHPAPGSDARERRGVHLAAVARGRPLRAHQRRLDGRAHGSRAWAHPRTRCVRRGRSRVCTVATPCIDPAAHCCRQWTGCRVCAAGRQRGGARLRR